MQKNLLNKEVAETAIARVQKLAPATKARWGKMTATEMLLHLNKVHEQLLSPAAPSPKKTTLKQWLLRWLVLYILPKYPRGAKTPRPFNTKNTIDEAAFEAQKEHCIQLLQRFAQHREPIQHYHPYFGALTTTQWGQSSWKHADHHLRQFGV